jgi:tripartite-type tricarboxylate transporter receptor subunit TctC/plasmid stabilization system protein ParE
VRAKPVIPRERADRDADEAIAYYLRENAPDAALGFIDALEQAYGHIGRYPESGSSRYAGVLDLPGLRAWPLKKYPHLVFYLERADHIDVWRIHGQLDIPASMRALDHQRRLRMKMIAFAATLLFAGSVAAQSAAQWPERPVRLLVTVGAGGAADTLSRNLASGFAQKANGQALVVENRPGAGGTVAASALLRERPDGYTLFLAEVGPNAVSHTLAKLSYDPHTAFAPIIHVANLPAVILVRSTLPYKTLEEYIAAAKQQPGKFNYASAGLGNWTHLFHAYLNSRAGIEPVNIVYRSGAEMLTALLRGDADTAIITVSTSLGQVRDGKIRALAGASMRPMRQLPDVPPAGRTSPAST